MRDGASTCWSTRSNRIEPYLAAAVAAFEERLAERLQNETDAVQAQFTQVHETMATNLATVLAAIGERP